MLTDQDEMLELMKHNIALNEVDDKATAFILNWYDFSIVQECRCQVGKLVLGSAAAWASSNQLTRVCESVGESLCRKRSSNTGPM